MTTPPRRPTAWLIALTGGLTFAVAMATAFRLQEGTWWPAIGIALVGGVVFGGVLGPLTARLGLGRPVPERLVQLEPARRRAAARAAVRGPAPRDPELREAALAFARHKRLETGRARWWAAPTFLLFAALQVFVGATSGQPWYFVVAALLALTAAVQWWWPAHLSRREQHLASAGPRPD